MFFFIYAIVLDFLFLSSMKISKGMEIDSVCTRMQTTTINGFFILLVTMSHLSSYTKDFPFLDSIVIRLVGLVGQYMVSTFLFFSGFGVFTSIMKSNGGGYTKMIPCKRILITLLNFDIAILVYFLFMIFTPGRFHFGIEIDIHSAYDVAFSFLGLKSAGNSNWYIVAILFMYAATYLSFRWTGLRVSSFVLLSFFTLLYIVVFHFAGYGAWWYDTVFCYLAGMVYAVNKDRFFRLYNSSWGLCIFVNLLLCLLITALNLKGLLPFQPIVANIGAILFANIFVILNHRIEFNSHMLLFFGTNLFGIYIMQRIPMRYLRPLIDDYYLYNIVCVSCAVLIGVYFQKIFDLIDTRVRMMFVGKMGETKK